MTKFPRKNVPDVGIEPGAACITYDEAYNVSDYTDFIRHQEEIGELSDGDSEVEITDELLSDTKPKPGKDNNIVVSAKRGRGRPKKPITETFRPYVCNGSGESGSALDQEGVEVTRMEGITWVRKPKKPRFEFDKVEKRGRPIFRSSEKPGDYVQIKPDLAELTDKTQLNELQQQNTRVVKRKEYTYRPPSREPEVVLVMPPVDKPIVQVNVRDRAFTCTKDGKYKSLGKANKGMLIPNQKKDAQEPVLDATDKSRYKDPNRGLSEEVVVKKYNAVMRNNNEKLTVKDIQNAGNYKYKPKTAPKENRGSICVKLPVKSVDGNIAVEFPVANIESTGNIHVQLSANNIENAKANVKIPNVVSSTGGPVNSVTDKAATKNYPLSKTGQETQTGVNTDKSAEPPVLTVKDVPNTQRSTKGPPLITAESRFESQAAPQTLERLAEHVKSKSVGLATSSPTNKTVKMLSSTLSRTPGTPASKRVIVIRKPSGSATPAGLIATEIPAPGPSTSVMLSPGPSPSIMPSKRLSTLKILSTGEIVSTASVGTDSSEVSSVGTVASETPSIDRDINAVSSTQSPRPDITVTGPVIPASGSLDSRSTKVVRIDPVPAASVSNPVRSVQSWAVLNSAVHVPGPQGLTEMSFPVMSSPGQPVMQSPGPDNQTVPTVPEFSAVPFTQSEQQMDSVPVSGILRKTEKQRKKRAFDKSRYTAFVKEDEMTKYTEKAPKKPKLYSLNPFCVPISLLDIGK